MVELGGFDAVGVDGADWGGGQNLRQVGGDYAADAAVAGTLDVALGNHIPQSNAVPQEQRPLFRNGDRDRFPKQRGQHLPESVLRMAVKEIIFPGFDRGQCPEDQNPGIFIVNRRKGMGYVLVFHGITLFSHIECAIILPQKSPSVYGGTDMKAVTTAQMKEIDRIAIEEMGIPSLELMENAARAVTDAVMQLGAKRVVIVCGTGNNGGDGLACARQLMQRGCTVTTILVGDPAKQTPDSAANTRRLAEAGGELLPWNGTLPAADCIVDALFGFGLNREVTGMRREVIAAMNAAAVPIVACDIPSGLNGDTGLPMGIAVKAAQTITFTCPKVGLLAPEAAAYVGRLTVAEIGIPKILIAD